MSILTQRYGDPSPGQAPSAGPRQGFAGAFELAYDAQVRGWAQFGLERSFSEADAEQRALIRDRTGGEPAGLSEGLRNMPSYLKMARYFEDGGTPETAEQVNKWDAEIAKLQGQHPELKTYRQLWEDVKGRANRSENRWDDSTTSWGGMVGGFLGGAVASMDPRSDPLNTLSLGIAPGAQTVARRLAVAAGGNAAVEAINQFTGVQENRRLLGLENSTGQAVKHILFAGAVGGGFQGGGELIAAGVRRLTATRVAEPPLGTPGQPPGPLVPADVSGRVPAWDTSETRVSQAGDVGRDVSQLRPSDLFGDVDSFVKEVRAPWAESRLGQRRMQQELDQTVAHMQRFDAEGPFEHQPRSRTAVQEPVTRASVEAPWWIRDQDQVADELARHYDPELYRQLDTIDAQTQELRSRADTLRSLQTTDRAKHVDAEIDRVQDLERQIEQLRSKAGSKRYKQRDAEFKIRVLNSQQRRILQAIKDDALRLTDAQTEAFHVAQKLVELGHARDTLVPLQKHAESVARGEMVLHMPSTEALVMFDRLAAYGVDITPRMSQRVSGGETRVGHDGTRGVPSQRVAETLQPGETQGQAVVRTTKGAAADLDDGDVLVQRVRKALAEDEELQARQSAVVWSDAILVALKRAGGPEAEERIVGSAAKIDDRVYTGIIHADAYGTAWDKIGGDAFDVAADAGRVIDGYITNKGRFLTRHEADTVKLMSRPVSIDDDLRGEIAALKVNPPEVAGVTVDLGSGPMRLDQEIAVTTIRDGDGVFTTKTQTVRQLLKEIDDDEAMVRAIATCSKE